jgi:two-component system LytT family response regulator
MGETKKRIIKNQLTAFVVDDEPGALNILADDLEKMPEFSIVKRFSSYEEATLPLLEMQPDVIFLDVEMPGRTGLEFLDSVQKRINFSINVVFYTGFSNYMIDAIRHSAFDFILKPYKESELKAIVERLVEENTDDSKSIQNVMKSECNRKLAVQTSTELLIISPEELLMIQYEKETGRWRITLTDGSTHHLKSSTNAADIQALHPSLLRISSNCIINSQYLLAVENNTLQCKLCPPFNDITLVASRRYFSKLKEAFELI